MLPDRVSNPGPLTYESGALPIALRGPAHYTYATMTHSYPPLDMGSIPLPQGHEDFYLQKTSPLGLYCSLYNQYLQQNQAPM